MDYVSIQNLKKTYRTKKGPVHSLRGVSFDIRKGEILGLLGPNGAGKTTTINILAGLLLQDQGTVRILGKDPEKHHEEIRPLVSIASAYQPLSNILTVYENLKVYGMLYNISNLHQNIHHIAKLFQLQSMLKKQAGKLSSGQSTRVVLAKCFLTIPRIILMDECTIGLDPDVARGIRNIILEYRKNTDCAILFTSHNMNEVELLCDRVAFLHNGKIHDINTPEKLLEKFQDNVVYLYAASNTKNLVTELKKHKIQCKQDPHNTLTIHVKKYTMQKLITLIASSGVKYRDLVIDRPDLEDYFLALAKK